MKKIFTPYYEQSELHLCSVACIRMILRRFNIIKTEKEIIQELSLKKELGIRFEEIKEFFEKYEFKTYYYNNLNSFEEFIETCYYFLDNDFSIIALVNRFTYDEITPKIKEQVIWENNEFSSHYIIITKITKNFVYFNDPHKEIGLFKLKKQEFNESCNLKIPWKLLFLAVKK